MLHIYSMVKVETGSLSINCDGCLQRKFGLKIESFTSLPNKFGAKSPHSQIQCRPSLFLQIFNCSLNVEKKTNNISKERKSGARREH